MYCLTDIKLSILIIHLIYLEQTIKPIEEPILKTASPPNQHTYTNPTQKMFPKTSPLPLQQTCIEIHKYVYFERGRGLNTLHIFKRSVVLSISYLQSESLVKQKALIFLFHYLTLYSSFVAGPITLHIFNTLRCPHFVRV